MLGLIGLITVSAICLLVVVALISEVRRLFVQISTERLARERLNLQVSIARKKQDFLDDGGKHSWNGVRKFVISRKVMEGGDICSFHLTPQDEKPLPTFKPGQYLTFQLNIPGKSTPTIRCYSLSDAPSNEYFRVSIKLARPPRDSVDVPSGLSSSYFHQNLKEGDVLDVKAPRGEFHIELEQETPVVLIGGGVGITPMLSMLNAIAATGSKRETWLFFGVRNNSEYIMQSHFETLVKSMPNVHLRICMSDPGKSVEEKAGERAPRYAIRHGRVSVDLFKAELPSSNYDYYICGPGPMMDSITKGLDEWGVPKTHVHFESFGPASVKKAAAVPSAAVIESESKFEIAFTRSGKVLKWDPTLANILEFAEKQGIALESGCRAGNCGACAIAVRSGSVRYPQEPGATPAPDTCLACIAVPKGDLTLDA